MQREHLQQALQECHDRQKANRETEERRREEVFSACPDIARLTAERLDAIMQGVKAALSGVSPATLVQDTERRGRAIETLLQEHGFPKDYLDPVFTCPLCRDTGFTGEHKKEFCACVLNRVRRLECQDFAMPETEETFQNYDETVFPDILLPGSADTQRGRMNRIRSYCQKYAEALPMPKVPNLLFSGKSGLGKTYLLRSIAHMAREKGIPTLLISANALLSRVRAAYFSHENADMDLFYNTSLLLIDDLGTEPMWENITVEQLFSLLDTRFTSGKNTVISTNLSPLELQARYTERIASRLLDKRVCAPLEFLGQDVRRR